MNCTLLDCATPVKPFGWKNASRITFSRLHEIDMKNYAAPTYSIKYVMQGTEHYRIGKKNFAVGAGRFLVVNKDTAIDFRVRSKKKVLGLCIHLESTFVQQAYMVSHSSEQWLLDNPCEGSAAPYFEELLYGEAENDLGNYLQSIKKQLDPLTGTIDITEEELYRNISMRLTNLYGRSLQRNSFVRSSTQKELLSRLRIAKQLMDEGETDNMERLAYKAMLSPAHFYRSFRAVYGMSPYRYLVGQRLERAAAMLKIGKLPTEVAYASGYADLPTFSKAFRKEFKVPPSSYGIICTK